MQIGFIIGMKNPVSVSAEQNIASLFAAGEQGVWYDPSDFTTLFQDSAGTIPVTAVEQPVGLMLDKSKGLVLGPDIKSTGTVGLVGTATAASYNTSTGVGSVSRVDIGNQSFVQFTGLDVGVYIVTLSLTSGASVQVRGLNQGGTVYYNDTTLNTPIAIYASPLSGVLSLTTAGLGTAGFTVTSIRKIEGNHASQPTPANRPVLSARVNLFTETEFRNGVTDAPLRGGLVTATTLSSYAGALAFGHDGSTNSFAYKTSHTAVIGQVYVLSVVVSMTDGLAPTFGSAVESSVLNSFALVVARDAVNPTTYTVTNLGGGLYRVSATRTASVASPNFGVVKYGSNNSSTFKVTAYQLETGSVATTYQRVNTATDYDTIGFKKRLSFNGTTQSMSTAAINFSATDKMMVCAGVRKLSDAAAGMVAELSANWNTNNGSLLLLAPNAAGTFEFGSKGTTAVVITRSGFTAPVTAVLTQTANIAAPSLGTRVNGVASATSSSSQGTGNYGNQPLFIGSRAGTSLFFNGNLYGLVIRGAASSAQQIASCEYYMNGKTGAY